MDNLLTIQIPFDLARIAVAKRQLVRKYETNQLIKALDTWLILKASSTPGLIQSWNKQKNHLLTICKVSESIFRHRLKLLQQLKLLKFDRQNIRLCSWEQMGRHLYIDIQTKFSIQYNHNDKQRVQDWLIATEIKENQDRQAYSIRKKLNKNTVGKQAVISELLKAGADRFMLKDMQYFLAWMKVVYLNDFVRASAIHDLLVEIRPDCNRGVKGMASAWNCKTRQTVTYWKHKLQRSGIIDIVRKLQIESQERVRNPLCHVRWLDDVGHTALCLCDQITLLTPWTVCKDNTTNTDRSTVKLSAT